jgi:hypothetical protein
VPQVGETIFSAVTFSVGSFMSSALTRPDAEASRSVLGLSDVGRSASPVVLVPVVPRALSESVPVTSTLWFKCWLNDTLESLVFSRKLAPDAREAALPRSTLVSTYCAEAPVEEGAAATGDAALPAPEPAPVAGAIVRLSHVLRQPVTVVDVRAMSDEGELWRVAGAVGDGEDGVGVCGSVVGSGGRCAGWLGGVCCVGGVCVGGCCAARLKPEIATTLHTAKICFFMVPSLAPRGHVMCAAGGRT